MNIISENQFNVLQDIISKTDAKFNERLEQINNTNSMKEIADICRLQIDGELLNYIKSNFKNIKLTESFMGVRFEYIYSKKPKFLYNGSDPRTKDRLSFSQSSFVTPFVLAGTLAISIYFSI